MTAVALRSPAKINWTLDILGRRDDGYHEVRTVMQTIALADIVTVSPADGIELSLSGTPGALADEPTEHNLAFRAATLLKKQCAPSSGARIEIEKRIPIAAGLGGGSSNAAAVLRALRTLWRLSLSDNDLAQTAADLGSDVPFFLTGGMALGSGRGSDITPLPDIARQRLLLAWDPIPRQNKTAEMYAALEPADFGDGSAVDRHVENIERGLPISDDDISNSFESVLGRVDPDSAQRFADAQAFGKPHLAGSGPAFFFLLSDRTPIDQVVRGLTQMGLTVTETHTLSAAEALEPA